MEQARLVEELRAHLPALVTTLPVIAVYLVGSRSDGSDRPSSDVDLAVLAGPLGDPLTRTLDFELFAAPLRRSALVATAQGRH